MMAVRSQITVTKDKTSENTNKIIDHIFAVWNTSSHTSL